MIGIKRVYESTERSDGVRFLVDHLWPRGMKKENAHIAGWLKAVAPSTELRQWFGHEPAKWQEFERRYFAELATKPEAWEPLLDEARQHDVTLVFSARDTEHNNAVALKEFLEKKLAASTTEKTRAKLATKKANSKT